MRDLKLQESERLNAVEVDHIDTEPSGLMPMRVRTIEEAARESVGNILRIDFGKVYPAFVKLKMHANESCELNITYRETFDGQNIRYTTLKLPAGDCEYFSAQLHSFRYIDIDGADGVTITYNFTSAKAKLVAHFHGHLHNFRTELLGTNGVISMTIPNACINRNNEYGYRHTFGS